MLLLLKQKINLTDVQNERTTNKSTLETIQAQ